MFGVILVWTLNLLQLNGNMNQPQIIELKGENLMKMLKRLTSSIIIPSVLALLLLIGCAKEETQYIKTLGIHADIEIQATGNHTTDVTVDLSTGSGVGGTDLVLSDGDVLTAEAGNIVQVLSKSASVFDVEYITTFGLDDADIPFTISLIRDDGTSAENSTVTLPPPVDLLSPADGSSFFADDYLSFVWYPSEFYDDISGSVNYDCDKTSNSGYIVTVSGSKKLSIHGDPGIKMYSIHELTNLQLPEIYDQGCELEVTFTRSRYGRLDDNFGKGGSIVAKQIRTIDLYYYPY